MPNVSVIIPAHNRSESLRKAIRSVLDQSYQDLELIVVDDGSEPSMQNIVNSFRDSRIHFIRQETSRGGGAARNAGVRASSGNFIAFLDDDDEWVPEKLAAQMKEFEHSPADVGFCFSAVTNIYDDHEEISHVLNGVHDHFVRALGNPKGYLTVTLVIKRTTFDCVGLFDESLPSHQEADLAIRMARHFRGLGIDLPLVRVTMRSGHTHVGGQMKNRIPGREAIIRKNLSDLLKHPEELASHYFQLGLWHRQTGNYTRAKHYFLQALRVKPEIRYVLHAGSMLCNARGYKLFCKFFR